MRRADKINPRHWRRGVRLLLCFAWDLRYCYLGAIVGGWLALNGYPFEGWGLVVVGYLLNYLLIDRARLGRYSKRLNVSELDKLPWWWQEESK